MRIEKDSNSKTNDKLLFRILLCIFLTTGLIVLSALTVSNTEIPFLVRHEILFSTLAATLFVFFGGLWLWCAISAREIGYKTLFTVCLFLGFVLSLILLLQRTGFFLIIKDPTSLQAYLQGAGRWMSGVYIVLQYLQVVILPIPAFVSTIAGVALFGAVRATVYSLIGILLGSLTAFAIGRKLGGKAVAWIVGRDELRKWQKRLKGKDNFFLTIAFFLPLFPDDLLCFLAGLSSMSLRYFLTTVFFARSVGVVATCFSFDFIPFTTWWGIAIWCAMLVTVLLTVVLVYKNMDRIQKFFFRRARRKTKK